MTSFFTHNNSYSFKKWDEQLFMKDKTKFYFKKKLLNFFKKNNNKTTAKILIWSFDINFYDNKYLWYESTIKYYQNYVLLILYHK